jgi:hypothetical protein
MNCPSCGNEVFEGAEICFDCGEPLIEGAERGHRTPPEPEPVAVPSNAGSFRSTPPNAAAPPKKKRATDEPDPIRCPGCGCKNAPESPRCRNCGDPLRSRD